MTIGTEVAWSLGQSSKQCALCEGQLSCRLAKIATGAHLDPPGAASEIDRVEVELENLSFAEHALKLRGRNHLTNLALIAQIVANQQVFCDLLSDGRTALWAPGLRKVAQERTDQPALIDAVVRVEPLVFNRHKCPLYDYRNVAQWYR